jgi:hypothetical protein
MGRKPIMAYPISCVSGGSLPHRRSLSKAMAPPCPASSVVEHDHQVEKLEFALAVAISRGDRQRSDMLRHQIEVLGCNLEEPGT